jgi:hypothetical protein
MVFEDGEEKIANLGALFFSALSLLFMLIGTIGASTLFTPGDETSAMPELSMLRWHPVGAIQYFFGLTRAVYQRREVNEDADDGGFDDDTDDEFNWYFNVLEYKDCKDTGGTLSGASFSADMCNECYEAGLKTKDILTSICILFFLLRFAAPMVVMALPTSSVKQQVRTEPCTLTSLGFLLTWRLPATAYYFRKYRITFNLTLALTLTYTHTHSFYPSFPPKTGGGTRPRRVREVRPSMVLTTT